LKIWGSPWTKTFEDMNPLCKAFTVDTDQELAEKWSMIPDGIDILITHSPSFGNLDYTRYGESAGSLSLWMTILSLGKRPKLHVFGHIHEAYGMATHHNGLILVNASHMTRNYNPSNKPIRIIL
jgi:Icc-related predicted phosphoesterase